jgi:hypothetical protein
MDFARVETITNKCLLPRGTMNGNTMGAKSLKNPISAPLYLSPYDSSVCNSANDEYPRSAKNDKITLLCMAVLDRVRVKNGYLMRRSRDEQESMCNINEIQNSFD